jgi:hypothetical protein
MLEDLLDHRPSEDGRDDLQFVAAVRANARGRAHRGAEQLAQLIHDTL